MRWEIRDVRGGHGGARGRHRGRERKGRHGGVPVHARAARLVRAVRRGIAGEEMHLGPALLGAHPELALARWRRGGLPLRVGGWCLGTRSVAGITLRGTVFLEAGADRSMRLLLHELEHVRQFRRDRRFPLRYLWESVRRGYAGNRYEAAADQSAEEALWSGTPRRPS